MALITKDLLDNYADRRIARDNNRYDSDSILFYDIARRKAEFAKGHKRNYDIFLCHSSLDAKTILVLREYFSSFNLTTYIDWYDDIQLDRSKVNRETADVLRDRMRSSDCLLYASSDNSPSSKWMPWECGYFDGIKSKVAICPISESATQSLTNQYNGVEYLDLYPYLATKATKGLLSKPTLYIHESPTKYVSFQEWLKGQKPKPHLIKI